MSAAARLLAGLRLGAISVVRLFVADRDGSNLTQLTDTWRYDAEATISRDGSKIVFTSLRDGDLDIYTMDADGSNVRSSHKTSATTAAPSSLMTAPRSSTGLTTRKPTRKNRITCGCWRRT